MRRSDVPVLSGAPSGNGIGARGSTDRHLRFPRRVGHADPWLHVRGRACAAPERPGYRYHGRSVGRRYTRYLLGIARADLSLPAGLGCRAGWVRSPGGPAAHYADRGGVMGYVAARGGEQAIQQAEQLFQQLNGPIDAAFVRAVEQFMPYLVDRVMGE